MKELFVPKKFGAEAQRMIEEINSILTNYERQGFDLSLRQIYYQFIARNLFPQDRTWTQVGQKWIRDPNGVHNAEPNYKWLGDIVSDARLAGLIDWEIIKDRGRQMVLPTHWESPSEVANYYARYIAINRWENQPCYVEVFVEKQALEGVLIPTCRELDVPFTANKGYSSSTALYEASKRYLQAHEQGKTCYALYLGDHDPSGIDMSRDVLDRLQTFLNPYGAETSLELNRLALNLDQIEVLNPPPNPAKLTDSRAAEYVALYGESSWELDAIEPTQLAQIVKTAVESIIDESAWEESESKQQKYRDDLADFAEKYDEQNNE